MQRVHALGANDGLLLSVPFLPSPLIEMLGGMGFASKIEPGLNGVWHVYFWLSDSNQ